MNNYEQMREALMTIRDAENRVIVSAINPCNMAERRQIVEALNATLKESGVAK